MNPPKMFEGALAATLVAKAGWTTAPRIRCWQSVSSGTGWTATNDRTLPMLQITGAPTALNDDGVTLMCSLVVLLGTHADDDKTHTQISAYYGQVRAVLDKLYIQRNRTGAGGLEYTAFTSYLSTNYASDWALMSLGGFWFGAGLNPYEDSGVNFMGTEFIVHYTRSDF